MKGCKNCKRWNGTCASSWGDCQHVIFDILPMNFEDRFGNKCEAPLDPHDLQYYLSDSGIHKEMYRAELNRLPHGVRREDRKEMVFWMDDHGEQTVKTKLMTYLQTHKDFVCERYSK